MPEPLDSQELLMPLSFTKPMHQDRRLGRADRARVAFRDGAARERASASIWALIAGARSSTTSSDDEGQRHPNNSPSHIRDAKQKSDFRKSLEADFEHPYKGGISGKGPPTNLVN
jgi:hypothetical protein